MSVIVKGMNMPKGCGDCLFRITMAGCYFALCTPAHECPLEKLVDESEESLKKIGDNK